MKLHAPDLASIVIYFVTVVLIGRWISRRGSKDLNACFPGGNKLPWYLLGPLLSKPESNEVLKQFYKSVNPWGVWGLVREQVMRDAPSFRLNPDFGKEVVNAAVGSVWRISLTALPIYLVLREWTWAGAIAAILAVTSVFLKSDWYDKMEKN